MHSLQSCSSISYASSGPSPELIKDFPVGFRVIISEERQEFLGELHSVGWLDSRGKVVVIITTTTTTIIVMV